MTLPEAGLDKSPPPAGYRWVWVPDPHWVLASALDAPHRCRWTEHGVRCPSWAVAKVNRRAGGHPPRWWFYCADHLFGRVLADGIIWTTRLVPA